jgi:Phosphotransferase enzyme family
VTPGAAETAWIDAHVERTGEVEVVRVRPWATVRRVPTPAGTVWMKAARSGTAFEVPLYELLAREVPERVLTPIAVDVERSWLLLPDGGPSLGEREAGLEALVEALVEYGRLQRRLESSAGEMLGLGVADMRPAAMLARFHEALAAAGGHPEVEAIEPQVAAWCERLEASPLPASLDHNDLHPWNILEGPRYYDWGDSVVAHPFAAMLVPLGYLQHRHGEAALARARDAYLGVFADRAPHAELVETLELACRVAKIARALTWVRALQAAYEQGEPVDPDWATAPAETLGRLLHEHYLG